MQRDFDLIVTILGTLRDAETSTLSAGAIAQELDKVIASPLPAELVQYHLDLLADADLVKAVSPPGQDVLWRLTWKGHDALEQEDDDEDDD